MKKGKSKLAIELEWVSDVFDAIAGQGMNGESEAASAASPEGDSVGDGEDE